MNLVWFLTIATLLTTILGEFGHFPFNSPTSISVADISLCLTMAFLLIWQIGIKKIILIPFQFKLLILFWLVGVISLILSGNLNGGLYLVRFVIYSSSFWLGYLLLKSKQIQLTSLTSIIVVVGLVMAFLGFLQLIFYPDFAKLEVLGYDPHKERLASTFLDPNFTGAFLNIPFIIAVLEFIKQKKKLFLAAAIILFSAIILTFSRSAYLMLITEISVIGIVKYRKILILLFIGLFILFLTIPRFSERIIGGLTVDQSASERISSWQRGITIFKHNPVLGVGFDNLRSAYARYNLFEEFTVDGGHSGAGVDSSLILVLATTGVLGAILFVSWWLQLVYKLVKQTIKTQFNDFPLLGIAIIAGIFINSQFINSLFYPPIMLIIYLTLGALSSLDKERNILS